MTPPELDAEVRPPERAALERFDRGSLELVRERQLLQRVDAKFIVPRGIVPGLLAHLEAPFRVLHSDGQPWATYDTLYFDAPDFRLFHAHRRGRRPRHKVRVRHYVERDVCFLETKTKDCYAVTTKRRFERASADFSLDDEDREAIATSIGEDLPLLPALWLRFPRVTLLAAEYPERVTIDLGIAAGYDGFQASYRDTCIIEVKQQRFDLHSPARTVLRTYGLRPRSISKYCVGLSVLGRVERTNVFRPAIRELERTNDA